MANETTSVLAKKIAAAKSRANPSSGAAKFAEELAAVVAKSTGALLEAECTATAAATTSALGAAMTGAADPGVYYWLADGHGEPALLISVGPGFAGAMTTRLLGGDLGDIVSGGISTAVDFEMAASLIDMLTGPLNFLFHKPSSGSARLATSGRRGARAVKEVLRERENLATCAFAIDLVINGKPAPKAVSLFFKRAFLEQAGIFRSAAPPKKGRTDWAEALKRNLLRTEIPLTVILGRRMTSVGDLSRLQVGQVIDLDPQALARLEITASTSAGPASVACGRLGSWQSRKAVKLTTDIDRDFLQGL